VFVKFLCAGKFDKIINVANSKIIIKPISFNRQLLQLGKRFIGNFDI